MVEEMNAALRATDLQTFVGYLHIDKTRIGRKRIFREFLLDAACSFGILGYHVHEPSTSGTGQFVTIAQIVDTLAEFVDNRRICAGIECFVLFPSGANQTAVMFQIIALQGVTW